MKHKEAPMKKYLIIYAHANPESFNAAVKSKVIKTIQEVGIPYVVIDLYAENYNPVLSLEEMKGKTSDETKRYQTLISEATDIIFIFPVFWFRAPAILEGFIDKVFVPGFAYRFKKIVGKYGIPIPLLKDKRVITFMSHGAPALPVKTMYLNSVKYRFLLGFLSFCFSIFKCKIVQLWSVPFVNEKIREGYLTKTGQVISKNMNKH